MMDKDTRNYIIAIGTVLIVVIAVFAGLFIYSGMGRIPLTVIESESMQHSNDESMIGIIDTGDMAIMINPDKTSITTYVEGSQNGYSKFGDYGDVIIYNRDSVNSVIHRSILCLEYNGDNTWSAPSLKNYEGEWSVTSGTDHPESMSGTLSMRLYHASSDRYIDCTINLDVLSSAYPHSGYLTKGDNNLGFDQPSNISNVKGLIEKNRIKAVAGIELPWIGCIKLLIKDKNVDKIPSNSVPCLAILSIDIIMFFIVLITIMQYLDKRDIEEEIMNKPVRHSKRKI